MGAVIDEDLAKCDLIVGVKEIPTDKIAPGKVHICFSHSHKGQPKGVPLLQAFKEKKATLIDYELLTDEHGNRVLAFGRFAGYAGMINCLHGLGDRFLQLGYRTPFLVKILIFICNDCMVEYRTDTPLSVFSSCKEGGAGCWERNNQAGSSRTTGLYFICIHWQWKRLKGIQLRNPMSLCL